jgi:hypothetical protein
MMTGDLAILTIGDNILDKLGLISEDEIVPLFVFGNDPRPLLP